MSLIPNNHPIVRPTPSAFSMPPMGLMSDSLLQIMWRQRWIVLGGGVGIVMVGLLYLARVTPIYMSTSRVYVEQSGPRIIREMQEGVMTGSMNYLYTQVELMKATPILTEAMGRLEVRRMDTFHGVDNPVEYLKRHIDVTVGRKDEIVSVSFESPYPTEAAQVVNAVVDAYITFHSTRKRSTSAEVLKILQKEQSVREAELSEKSLALTELKEQNEALAFQSERGNIVLDRVAHLSLALADAQLVTLERRSCYEAAKAMSGDPAQFRQFIEAQPVGDAVRTRTEEDVLNSTMQALYLRRVDLLLQLTEDYPTIKALDAEIARTQDLIDKSETLFVQAHLAALEQQYQMAIDKEKELSTQLEEQRQLAVKLNRLIARYNLLQSQWEQSKKLCDILDDRIKELNVTEDVGALNITIVEAAHPATEPSRPRKAHMMAMILVMGLMAAGGVAMLRDRMDHRLHNPEEEVIGLLGSPLLGVVPAMSKRQSFEQRGQNVALEATSQVAEAFRTIRTGVLFGVPQDQARSIQVTSAQLGEGKSTIVSNLGIAMARSGQRILIIDADFRCPTQHVIFGVPRDTGLASVLAGLTPLHEAILHTAIPGLDVMPCGPEDQSSEELLGRRIFKAILGKLKGRYHRILVDSPPVSLVADASILAAVCDATLFVVHGQKSTWRKILLAKEALVGVKGRIVGAVINEVSPRKEGYFYGYGYGRGYDRQTRGNGEKKPNSREYAPSGLAVVQPFDRVTGGV